jgi:hypothetical protein
MDVITVSLPLGVPPRLRRFASWQPLRFAVMYSCGLASQASSVCDLRLSEL